MSSINGINPQSSILQQIMDDARLHGHGGGHKQRVKQAGPEEEPAKPNQTKPVQPKLFARLIQEAQKDDEAQEAERRDFDSELDQHQGRQQGQDARDASDEDHEPKQEGDDLEAQAAAVMAEWNAMNPSALLSR